METVTPQVPLLPPLGGEGIGARHHRHVGMEGRIHRHDVGHVGEAQPKLGQRTDRRWHVEGGEKGGCVQGGDDGVVDESGRRDALSAVHDPVADRDETADLVLEAPQELVSLR